MRARKGLAAVFAALVMTAVQAANLSVTDVKIAQRYPWNGLVDITYTVNCDDPNKDVWVYPVGYDADTATSVGLMPKYLSGAGASNAVHNGTHQMTWDMAKQMGKGYNRAAFSVTLHAYCDAAPYMVIDLSTGSKAEKYEVSYLSEIPEGGWTDEYKTTKMVFRLIIPGQVDVGTFITKPYYFALWPMTSGQYSLVMGGTGTSAMKTGLSYNDIRGSLLGAKYPSHQQVDADSIVGRLRLRTGITFDLSTQWQWKYAALAMTETLNKTCNVWGIYDCGEYCEWCLNWFSDLAYKGNDPVGATSGKNGARAMCGRYFYFTGSGQASSYSTTAKGSYGYYTTGSSMGQIIYSERQKYYVPSYVGFKPDFNVDGGNQEGSRPVCRLVALPVCK